jgi:hypothetical protein
MSDAKTPAEALTKAEAGAVSTLPLEVATIQATIEKLETVKKFIQKNLNASHRRLLKKIGKRAPTEIEKKQLRELEIDFGTIPGVNKPFLKQPGAEKIAQWMHVRPRYETEVTPIPDHPGHMEVHGRCRIMAVTPAGEFELFSGPLASCTTMESNYRYRWIVMDPAPTFEWSQNEGRLGKSLGTHRSFKKDEKWIWQRRHENPNIFDERNKVRQIGEKRMLVKAVRNWGALSEIFTEDPSEWTFEDESNAPKEEAPSTPGSVVKEAAPAAPAPEERPRPIVTILWPSDTSDVALVSFDESPEGLHLVEGLRDLAEFRDGKWLVPSNYVPDVAERALQLGMVVQETDFAKKPEPPPPAKSAGTNVPAPNSGIVSLVSKQTGKQKGTFYYLVVLNGRSLYCYKTDWFEYLAKAKDQQCEFEIQDGAYPKIVGIKRIGATEFEEGLPVIQR